MFHSFARRATSIGVAALSASTLAVSALAAQDAASATRRGQLDLAPAVGVFAALSDVVSEGDASFRHKPGAAIGGRATYWTSTRFGVAAALVYASSALRGTSGSATQSASARVAATTVRAVMRAGAGAGADWDVSAGLGRVGRGGKAYDATRERAATALALGAGATLASSRVWRVRLDLDDYVSSAKFDLRSSKTHGRLQNDLALTAGLSFPIWHR